ncbi:hypothetical protein ACFL2O_03785 [Thermodesulfobacteriota bacterium]
MGIKVSGKITRKIALSILILLVALLSYTSTFEIILDKTYVRKFDESGREYYNETLKRAFYTFAITRGINGIISVIQGTEVALSPAGIGVTLTVGEILDPINDLVERFSWVMLISTTSIGIQKIFLEIGPWLGLKVILTFSMLVILAGIWFGQFTRINFVSIGLRLVVLALVIRFCMPVVAYTSEKIYDLFLKEKYADSAESLNKIRKEIKDPYEIDSKKGHKKNESNFWEGLKKSFADAREALAIRERLEILKDKVANSVEYTIDLIIVFLLQTVIIPILVLWGLIRLIGLLFGENFIGIFERRLKNLSKGVNRPQKA